MHNVPVRNSFEYECGNSHLVIDAIKNSTFTELNKLFSPLYEKKAIAYKAIVLYGNRDKYEYGIERDTNKVYRSKDAVYQYGKCVKPCAISILAYLITKGLAIPKGYEWKPFTFDAKDFVCKFLALHGFDIQIPLDVLNDKKYYDEDSGVFMCRRYLIHGYDITDTDVFQFVKIELTKAYEKYQSEIRKFHFNKLNSYNCDKKIIWNNNVYVADGVMMDCVSNIIEPFFQIRDFGIIKNLHKQINDFIIGKKDNSLDVIHFENFFNTIKVNPYRTSWAIYDPTLRLASRIDLLDYTDEKYILYLWTDSCKIIKGGVPVKTDINLCKSPLKSLYQCEFFAYALLLTFQKYILEHNYNIKVDEIRLGVFNAKVYTKGYILSMPELEDEMHRIIRTRTEVLF